MPVRLATLLLACFPLLAMAQEDLVEQLLGQMTLEEKVGQLTQLRVKGMPTGPLIDLDNELPLPIKTVGSILDTYGAEQTLQLQRAAVESSRLHIPLLFAFDVLHGFRTAFPVPLAEAAAWDPDLTQRTARAAAVEATAAGVHWTFAPMLDITRDPRWGRVVEGAGEDPFLASALAVARVRGTHGDGPPETSFMLATAKHFVAYGAAEGGRDYNSADLSQRSLKEVYLPPFQAAVEAGVDAVMPGFEELAGTPMHNNAALLRGLLRGRWGFSGIIVSDWMGVAELVAHGVAASPADAARQALHAGIDIDMASQSFNRYLPDLVRSGQVQSSSVDDAVRNVLRAKQRLGLFEHPYRYSDPDRERAQTLTPALRALAREAGQKSIVLLKNTDALLPLPKDLHRVLVVGSLAADAQATLGSWAPAARAEDSVTVLQGIQRAVSSRTQVLYQPGASPTSPDTQGIAAAQEAARQVDVVVAVLGETAAMSGEAASRADLGLPGAQDALLHALRATGKPVVLVLMNGRPLALSRSAHHTPAILEAWFLGSEMGHAVADVLFGDVNPSGKLPITFARSVGQVPLYYAHRHTGRPATGKTLYESGYLDLPSTPAYPFGFGLSYTTFTYLKPRLSSKHLASTQTLTVRVTVSNTGPRAGDEIVQLYLREDVASVTRPVRQLRGFRKVHLASREARTVEFILDQQDFALLNEHLLPVIEAGTFTVFVGGSSTTDNQATFEVTDSRRLPTLGSAIPRMLRR
jgi:beta-glucosidase